MELEETKAIIEGLLFAAGDEGVTKKKLSVLLEVDTKTVNGILEEMKKDYNGKHRGLTIMDSQGTLHLTTKPEHASYYKKLLDTPGSTRLSQAALETLAIIAYEQPITRIEIDDLRGVKSDRAIQTLVNRGLIEEKGRKDAIGRPVLFGTTKDFLIYFGLTSMEQLPPLAELKQPGEAAGSGDLFFDEFPENPFDD
ncbi:SMC-Scp complex subunit ScpB [Halobacillus sp. ACCC02827]|uniref:SMC-Scp complex subunit ScpB n=1 Tax=Bacillaceae TaxID=186817 RepID=UPI0002A4E6C1|nr:MULTISPECIES: SMC-Scp complex subunit ScpB [Bacillaceae]ELK44424.1 segregation and condensation protein B [Halobacillus sp. BAB-2008]QHT46917.1 SMC-Scp complex subunit ScpB [Bacillus sp. SB49]WJE14140.1 SMC-Scp complex subunit ScpB [Halobacillus sp. ACCC02827]